MENQKIKKDDAHIGCYLYRTLNQKISVLLRAERLKRGLSYYDIMCQSGLSGQRVRDIEHNVINWYVAGRLLKYYHKRIIITLEDLDEDGRNLVFARMKDKPEGYHLALIDD